MVLSFDQLFQEELKDTKRVIRIVSRRIDNAMPKRKRTNNHLQNTTQKTKDRAKRTPIKTGGKQFLLH
jgi:hypothetical protein